MILNLDAQKRPDAYHPLLVVPPPPAPPPPPPAVVAAILGSE